MLGALIACIANGRTIHLLGRAYVKVTKELAVWYLKQWQVRICGFGIGMLSLI
jgi:hypothetical protein